MNTEADTTIKKRGRPVKYLTEEERREAILKSNRRPERKQYNYEYLKQWRMNKKISNE